MEIFNGKVVDAVGFHTPHGIAHLESASADASSLPPPPPDLLTASNSSYMLQLTEANAGRIRSFPHVEGNYALHVYIPV
ncbi:hypothetical protein GOP47_0016927 [Adiantum capillus-veneris]|uniref:U6 snRNA phosphodiesterase 1 n=1 Tax=Adiantum capillus-veneris TaxID=13818 RepID=A0A9D4UIZ6_ADICA|nr:hypothetical protein GOP47_0016927 [Adiantum capillus-veneris]